MQHKESQFEMLAHPIQRWIWQQGWTSLNEIQEKSIPIILKGDTDVVISAATAGGKTEAAFLPILSSVINGSNKGCKVLYISPLKALINDQYRRLSDLTAVTKTSITPWHQDISIFKKKQFIESPADILIITPESLDSFLINRRGYAESIFASLKYIVIDELHAFIGTERGKQLQSLLSRVEIITSRIIPRIAMSATFSDFENVKDYLRGNRAINCNIIKQEKSSHEVKILIKEYIANEHNNVGDDISNEIINKLRGTNNLVFVNSKADAEFYTANLSELCETYYIPNEFRIHHGNLSKEVREGVEKELQNGTYPVTAICTSTMELGVDIGKVKSIAQIEVANSVSSLRQRLGRSGRRNEASYLRIFSIDREGDFNLRENLFQNISVIELLKEKKYEVVQTSNCHFSTLIQQILSLIASYNSISAQELYYVLCKKGAFSNIDSNTFKKVLYSLGEKGVICQLNSGGIILGRRGESIIKEKDFYAVFYSADDYTVMDINSGRIGIIQDIPQTKTIITLGAKNWYVENVDLKRRIIYVSQAIEQGNLLFSGSIYPVSSTIINKMKDIYCSSENYKYLDANAKKELNIGREFFRKYNLENICFIKLYNANSENEVDNLSQSEDVFVFFTWAGGVINYTIKLIAEFYLEINVEINSLYISGISKNDVERIVEKGKPNAIELASQIEREYKFQQKYDYLLSDELLDISYAQTDIDVDGAWRVLEASIK